MGCRSPKGVPEGTPINTPPPSCPTIVWGYGSHPAQHVPHTVMCLCLMTVVLEKESFAQLRQAPLKLLSLYADMCMHKDSKWKGQGNDKGSRSLYGNFFTDSQQL